MRQLTMEIRREMLRARSFCEVGRYLDAVWPFSDAPCPRVETASKRPSILITDIKSKPPNDCVAQRSVDDCAGVFADCACLMDELENMQSRLSAEAQALTEHCVARLQEILEHRGAVAIDQATHFDIVRHRVVPAKATAQGAPINKVLRPGMEFNGKILRKACVELD